MSSASGSTPSYAAYLAMEAAADVRHEYVAGDIFAMSGASIAHNQLVTQVLVELAMRLRGGPCRPFVSSQRVRVEASDAAFYPDITVVCGPIETGSDDEQGVVNPTTIFEILSPSTERWDRGGKFEHLRRLPSLQTYVLVSQEKRLIERYTRNEDGSWRLVECRDELVLPALGVTLPVESIYSAL